MFTYYRKIFLLISLSILFYTGSGLCQLSTDAPWPMFHHDLRHTGKTTNFGTQVGKLKWRFVTGGPVTSSPAIDKDGVIYIGSTDNNFYAINAENGTLKWKYQVVGAIDKSSPAIDNNSVVYVGSYGNLEHGFLYAFDTKSINPNSPAPQWAFETNGAIVSSPAIAPDGAILFGCSDGNLYAVNSDGTLKWKVPVGDTGASPAIDPSVSQVYIGTWKPDVFYALDLATGATVWYYDLICGGVFASPVVASDGSIIFSNFTTYYGDPSCLDPMKFQIYNFSSNGGLTSGITATANWALDLGANDIYTTPAILGNNTFFIGSGTSFYEINPDGSKYLFTALEGQRLESSPAIDGGNFIFVGSNGGRFYCVHADRPRNPGIWLYPPADEDPLNGEIISSPAIGNDERHSVYVGATDGNVYAFYDGIRIKGKVNVVEGTGAATQRTPLQAVKMTLTSDILIEPKVTYTDSNGDYEFAGLENFTYKVTPEKTGFIFSPEFLDVTVKDQDVNNANFEAFNGFPISGTITDKNGNAMPGVTVTVDGLNSTPETTLTDGTGFYQVSGLGFDTYTVTPFFAGYGFTPPFQQVTIASSDTVKDKTNINFVGTLGYQISGKVTDVQGNGIEGVTIAMAGPRNDSITTDANGGYSFLELQNGTYTITPDYSDYDFNPPVQTVTIASASIYNVNFTAATGSNISGYIVEGPTPLPGVTVDLLDYKTKKIKQTVKTDPTGFYILIGVADGKYLVKPNLAGYGFNPVSAPVTVFKADVKNVNFRAARGLYISGTVLNILKLPAVDVTMELTGITTSSTTTTNTDKAGQYIFTGVEPGQYTVTVKSDNYQSFPDSQIVDIVGESRDDVNFTVRGICPMVFFNMPINGLEGTEVNIIGMNFGYTAPTVQGGTSNIGVYFGRADQTTWQPAEVLFWSDVLITVKAPKGEGIVRVWVITNVTKDGTAVACDSTLLPSNFFFYGTF
ncbi:MAG: PQQ-binding-like beta-propeller repeat protein [Proteobacteria bacterium]|nr:PQQ-binding-like beta-propeller repeat protein [Pseudomonadota bacterium]